MTVHPDAPGAVLDDALVDAVAERFWMADAILLPGGGDMSARWSGQQAHDTLYDVDEEQDAFDLALGRWALRDGIPLLAICRGNQVVNVARGGDLVQDMTESTGRDHRHLVHDIELDAESPLRKIVAGDRVTISCYHHQCLGKLGQGLLPAAHASDGTIEAVTIDGHAGVVSRRPVAPRGLGGIRPGAGEHLSCIHRCRALSVPHACMASAETPFSSRVRTMLRRSLARLALDLSDSCCTTVDSTALNFG